MKPYYEQDGITIYHGDCLEVLPELSEFDLVFTSPPYNRGMRVSKGWVGSPNGTAKMARFGEGYDDHNDAMDPGEYEDWQATVLRVLWEHLAETGAIFYNHKPRVQDCKLWTPLQIEHGLPLRQIIVWATGTGVSLNTGSFAAAHEWVMVFGGERFRITQQASAMGDVWTIPPEKGSEHPAPFPVGLPARAIRATTPESVLDPFMGSGTTLRAAKDAGARAIGIEKSERYCEIAAKRLAQGAFNLV